MNNLAIVQNETALANIAQFASGADSGNVSYLKFTKAGQFVYGQEESLVEEDEQFAANIESLSKGYICWKDGQVAGETMLPVSAGKQVVESELPDHGPYEGNDGWKEQSSIEFENLETGETLLFKTSSLGGTKALAALSKAFIDNLKRGSSEIIPVVSMETASYKHPTYGKIYTPKFNVVDWLGAGEDPAPEAEVVEVVEEKPKRSRRSTLST